MAGFNRVLGGNRPNSLKKTSFGLIIEGVPNRAKWYRYRESMIRGFARLIAESNGLTLNYEIYDLPTTNTVRAKETVSSYTYANRGLENQIRFRSERKYKLDSSDELNVISPESA